MRLKNAKAQAKAFKMTDEKGLYLLVKPTGAKYWRFKYRFGGKERLFSIGVYPEISLREAREQTEQARQLLRIGKDPSVEKRLEKLKRHLSSDNTFESVAREWYNQRKEKWSESHGRNIMHRLSTDFFPKLGDRPIGEITPLELLAVLRLIESRGALDIAHRGRSYCSQIFRYAVAVGKADRDVSTDLRGALKVRNPRNHARLEDRDMPTFLTKLEDYEGELQTKIALKLLIMTFVRTVELRGARWEEINFGKALWEIPASRMKMKQKHLVPLSKQALELLKMQQRISGNKEHVFPNRNKPQTFISENTLLYAIYRMGYHNRATSHGFRATASTVLNESGFDADVIERQLAHGERNRVRAAYNYAQYIPQRTQMMQWWADYLEKAGMKGV